MIKYSLILFIALVFFYSCGSDSGVNVTQNSGSITVNNLKTIDKNIEGTYELWGSVESASDHGENAYRSMGRFTVNSSGTVLDTSGAPFSPYMGKITNINYVSDIIVTIQPPGYNDTIPSNIKILGGPKNVSGGAVVFDLTMNYRDILPASSQFSTSEARFILASPSAGTASAEYQKGLWFTTDTNGTIAGLTLPVLPDTAEWTYQAWVINNSNSAYIYNMGRFTASNQADNNQQCRLNGGLEWNYPGHDWLQPNCPGGGLPDILSLNNGYNLLITLEPKYEQGSALNIPFYLKIFETTVTVHQFGTVMQMLNQFNSLVPTAQVRLTAN